MASGNCLVELPWQISEKCSQQVKPFICLSYNPFLDFFIGGGGEKCYKSNVVLFPILPAQWITEMAEKEPTGFSGNLN